jgi:valyl-tRNA synthetase
LQPINRQTYERTIDYLEQLVKLVHPFMPFLSEEIWQNLRERKDGDSICIAPFPVKLPDSAVDYTPQAEEAFEVITQVRNLKNNKQLSPKTVLPLSVLSQQGVFVRDFLPIVEKLANVQISETRQRVENALSFVVKADEYFVSLPSAFDKDKEREIIEKELAYQMGFRDSVLKKLQNEKYVANAKPDVVERERVKLADAEAKIKAAEERLKSL